MRLKSSSSFTAVRTEGAILPPDLLQRIVEGDKDLKGLSPDAYHLASGERINEAINRSWNRLQGAWTGFTTARQRLSSSDPGTGITRDRWLLVLFHELGFGRLVPARGVEVDGKNYPISHSWQSAPIHLVGCGVDLDKRAPGVVGAARSSPHSLVQEFLNRTEEHLWGFVSNGLRLRVLRDNASLVRQAFVEFDLEGMMEGEVYSDFVLLWLLCHQSRVELPPEAGPEDSWLEKWSKSAGESGARALEGLRVGVESAISALGRGFLVHPANSDLREKLRRGDLSPQDYYRQLLRICYRLIFLFVAEDRDLLLDPRGEAAAKGRYERFFSTGRLRAIGGRRIGSQHSDLYRGLMLVMQALGSEQGIPGLALKPLGSFLWSQEAIEDLWICGISNRDFLEAVRALSFGVESGQRRPVDFKNLGAEELGSIYESLLELHPELDIDAGRFELTTAGGHERRSTGSYYTPTSLISELLDSALDPLISEALKKEHAEQALISLKVVDPATGSGHFLIAAAHRIAKALAAARTGEDEPSPDASRVALRDVIGRCIYGVDVNEMAVELCKVSLWMETLEPGRPLSFLDHRILCGNSLLGATPELIDAGISDDAFKPIEGDDKEVAATLKARNKKERAGQGMLEVSFDKENLEQLSKEMNLLDALGDTSITEIRLKEQRYSDLKASNEAKRARLVADAWCVAFVGPKTKNFPAITDGVLWQLRNAPESVDSDMLELVDQLVAEYRFFHWHLEFPDVFGPPPEDSEAERNIAGWAGGFDVVLGNPPWDQIQLDAREFFATTAPEVVAAPHMSARNEAIDKLSTENPPLHAAYLRELRKLEGVQHFIHDSRRYPLTSFGRLNSAPLFAELMRTLQGPTGAVGVVLPTGIATDSFNQHFFQDLLETRSIVSLLSFENEEFIFPAVHHATRFCLLTLSGSARPVSQSQFEFFARRIDHLHDEERKFTLSPEEIALVNPNTRTCPIFRSRRDAETIKKIYERVPVLVRRSAKVADSAWGFSGFLMFMMNTASHLFRTSDALHAEGWQSDGCNFGRDQERFVPLYEGKMIHHFDHRFGTHQGQSQAQANQGKLPELTATDHANPNLCAMPRYWVAKTEVDARVGDRWKRNWFLAWRDITGATVKRTVIAAIIPRVGVGNNAPIAFSSPDAETLLPMLASNMSSYIFDFLARSKVGGTHLNFFILEQLPVLPPTLYSEAAPWKPQSTLKEWLTPRVLELFYTAWDLKALATDLGYQGAPFVWDEYRRFLMRCEIDAAYFHLYGTSREDVSYIMDTFPVVKRDEEREFEEYRSKRMILEIYDLMEKAIETGEPFVTILEPSPADAGLTHESQELLSR